MNLGVDYLNLDHSSFSHSKCNYCDDNCDIDLVSKELDNILLKLSGIILPMAEDAAKCFDGILKLIEEM